MDQTYVFITIYVMETLPLEIWQIINDKLDFYNQTNFKNTSTVFHEKIKLTNNYRMRMLWYCGYYDQPLNGVGQYNNKKVWFQILETGDYLDEEYYTPEIKSAIENYKNTRRCTGKVKCNNGEWENCYSSERIIASNIEYILSSSLFDILVEPIVTYKIYKLSDDVFNELEKRNNDFCEMVGYHCSCDLSKNKPYDPANTRIKEYNEKYLNAESLTHDLSKFEYLGILKYYEIERRYN